MSPDASEGSRPSSCWVEAQANEPGTSQCSPPRGASKIAGKLVKSSQIHGSTSKPLWRWTPRIVVSPSDAGPPPLRSRSIPDRTPEPCQSSDIPPSMPRPRCLALGGQGDRCQSPRLAKPHRSSMPRRLKHFGPKLWTALWTSQWSTTTLQLRPWDPRAWKAVTFLPRPRRNRWSSTALRREQRPPASDASWDDYRTTRPELSQESYSLYTTSGPCKVHKITMKIVKKW